MLIVAALIVVLVGILAFVVITSDGESDPELADQLRTGHENFPADMVDGTKVGSDDAPLKLVAFEDFQCPFCLQYTAQDEPTIIEEYVKTGKVQIEFRHLPLLGVESTDAARAAECAADQNRFWDFQNRLFLKQAEAGQASNERLNVGRFSENELRRIAEDLGLDVQAFQTCFESPDSLERVTDDAAEARQRGISGTPNFVLNDRTVGSDVGNVENWRKFLDEQYDLAVATPSASASATTEASATPTP